MQVHYLPSFSSFFLASTNSLTPLLHQLFANQVCLLFGAEQRVKLKTAACRGQKQCEES